MNHLFYLVPVLILTSLPLHAKSIVNDVENKPYVKSFLGGSFYARCLPESKNGNLGVTKVHKVSSENDELVHTYDWYYDDDKLIIGWHIWAKEFVAMTIDQQRNKPLSDQTEFKFYVGNKISKSYTTQDLLDLGAELWPKINVAKYTVSRSLQSRWDIEKQAPVFLFAIKVNGDTIKFDSLTGNILSNLN